MKNLLTILFILFSASGFAQFKNDKEAKKYRTLPLTIDSSRANTINMSGIKYQWEVPVTEKGTGKVYTVQFTLYKNGRWTEKNIN